MKGGGGSSYNIPAKRRWRCLVIGVLGLVFLSMLVPLVFLLGLYNGFHSASGHGPLHKSSPANVVRVYDQRDLINHNNQLQQKGDKSKHVNDLIRRLAPPLPQDYRRNPVKKVENKTAGLHLPGVVPKSRPEINNKSIIVTSEEDNNMKGVDEIEKFCELKFGSYCLWRQQHREKMNDSIVKKMKDLLYVARAYYPSIAKLPALNKLSQEMKQNIQDFERIFSEATTDTDLPLQIGKKIERMEAVISKAKSLPVDCNNVDKKLRQLVDLTEDEANFHMKQSAFLYQLAVQTMPKSLHCLSMRLTVEYFRSPKLNIEESLAQKYLNSELQHYVILSSNLLASSTVINSTVMHAKESENQVFHVLTDRENFFAMKFWFHKNVYKDAAVEVLNIEDLNLGHEKATPFHLFLPEEFRVSFPRVDKPSNVQIKTEYISVFSHSHFLLPKIFDRLKKVVVLDDDTIVQRDLSELWSINMDGKVIGSEQRCGVKISQLKHFLIEKSLNGDYCVWMSGLSIIDLVKWRQQNLSGMYQRLVQEKLTMDNKLPEAVTLRGSMLILQGLVYALDDRWVLSGLGHNYGLDIKAINNAAVLHYNGKMKPWLDMGIPKYKGYWRKFLNCENQFLSDCNVNP